MEFAKTAGSNGKGFFSPTASNPLENLRASTKTMTQYPASVRNLYTAGAASRTAQSLACNTLTEPINDIKPKLLESKVGDNVAFFRLSDGFKKIFADDKKDQKMVIPIVGFGGHRRGDRS